MSQITQRTSTALAQAARRIRETHLSAELAIGFEKLAAQVNEPCVVAVVGRVKAGKSTFINALLGEDLAKVGVTETTATINFFRYGNPDQHRPVCCHWRGGATTYETRSFLDGLQGNDEETLRRADGVDYLEYLIPNPWLRQITLVDTPGTGAVVDKHQNRSAEYLKLYGQLRDRHSQQTERLGNEADAVIYLFGAVARASDDAFLEEFAQSTNNNSKAFNAIGVMAKIELQPEILDRRHELSGKIAARFQERLNTVLPVATAVRRALDRWLKGDEAGLEHLIATIRRIPKTRLEMLLDSAEIFTEEDFDDCPISAAERRKLLDNVPWRAFATIAQFAADDRLTKSQIIEQLDELTGFRALEKVLEDNFIKRGHILRCYRIVNDARKILQRIRFDHLPECRRIARDDQAMLDRFVDFIEQDDAKSPVALELKAFLQGHLNGQQQLLQVNNLWRELDRELGMLYHDLLEYNADFDALRLLEDHIDDFASDELGELRALLGLYGMETDKRIRSTNLDIDYVGKRQLAWRQTRDSTPYGTFRRQVAERAFTRYGLILNELLVNQRLA